MKRLTEGLYTHESVRMGEVLVEMGLLTSAQVYDALSQQVREKIVTCFRWEHFSYDLVETLGEDDELGIFQCPPVGALILAGIREHYDGARRQPWLGRLADGLPVLRRPWNEVAERFGLNQAEQKFVRGLDGTHALHAIPGAGLDEADATALLCALSLCRELVLEDAPPEAAELPEIKLPTPKRRPAASAAPAAPAEPAPTVKPIRKPRPGKPTDSAGTLRRQLGAVKLEARPKDAKQAALEAENCFNQGLRLYGESLLPGALKEFQRATQHQPEEPEYRMMEAWLEYRIAKGDAKKLAFEKAKSATLRLLEKDKHSSRAHSILGHLLHAEEDTERALRHLKIAVHNDPDDADANRLLRILNMRAQKKR